jgi:transcriptional regulator with XRE-family HTH domain
VSRRRRLEQRHLLHLAIQLDQTFGSLLKRHRLAARLSQEQLAERAGLTAQAVSALERGFRRAPYRDTVRALAKALMLTPTELSAFEASVRRGRLATPADAAPVRTSLPVPSSPLIGREREVAEVTALLHRPQPGGTVRLLTLLGPGGVGKTRLARRVAEAVAAEYADGTLFVALAPVSDATLVVAAIAQVLGVAETDGRDSIEAVRRRLRDLKLFC